MNKQNMLPLDPVTTHVITLGTDAAINRLFGSFRLHNPRGVPFVAQREVEIVANSGHKISVTVPEAMRVAIPDGAKLVNTGQFHISPIGVQSDVMYLLTMRAGWNQTPKDIQRMIALDPRATLVGNMSCADGEIPLATASVLPLGQHNTWIGMILVHPEARRQGIANAMMQACVKQAIHGGKIINGLDATPMGNTVYGAVGYVDSYRIWRSVFELSEFAGRAWDQEHVSAMQPADLETVIRYDATAFLERETILRELYADANGIAFVYRDDHGAVQGYCLTRPGRLRPFVGPFVADSEEIARNLLTAAAQHLAAGTGDGSAFLDTPENKFNDRGAYAAGVFDQSHKPARHILSASLKPVRDFTRMYQLVSDRDVDTLVQNFMAAEKLDVRSERVIDFRATMERSVANYSVTRAFMELEREQLQEKYWGITGPEKG